MRSKLLKMGTVWVGMLVLRLVPFRPANLEPVMASAWPVGKRHGGLVASLYALLGMLAYDFLTTGLGLASLITAPAYALVAGVGANLARRYPSRELWLVAGLTVVYDILTGLTIGPLCFGQALAVAAVGQASFTLSHVAGNVTLTALVSPWIEHWLTVEPGSNEQSLLPFAA